MTAAIKRCHGARDQGKDEENKIGQVCHASRNTLPWHYTRATNICYYLLFEYDVVEDRMSISRPNRSHAHDSGDDSRKKGTRLPVLHGVPHTVNIAAAPK